jgi:transketolase
MYALLKVDNLIATVDLNGKQIDGTTDEVLLWEVFVPNLRPLIGKLLILKRNNIEAIISGMTDAKSRTGKGKPVCVLLHTEMGNGVDYMMYSHAWHGKRPMHNLKTH